MKLAALVKNTVMRSLLRPKRPMPLMTQQERANSRKTTKISPMTTAEYSTHLSAVIASSISDWFRMMLLTMLIHAKCRQSTASLYPASQNNGVSIAAVRIAVKIAHPSRNAGESSTPRTAR